MKDETLFYHGTSADGRRFTIAGQFQEEGADLVLGISVCSPGDQFIKKIGRKKSEGRLKSYDFKGCAILDLYTSFFNYYRKSVEGFADNWFISKKIEVFLFACKSLEILTFKELKNEFNLN